MNDLTVINQKGKLIVDSREIAEMVNKEHKHLLRDIKNYMEILGKSKIGLAEFFIESYYNDSQGKPRPHYYLTRKGCDMVANKMTGEKGVLFTASYVTKFEEMESELKNQIQVPQTFAEALRLAADLEEERQKLLPKAEYFDALVDRNLLTNFRDTAKELKVKQNEFIQWLQDNKYIYRDSKGKLRPYADYVPDLFEVKEFQNGNWASIQTLITPKGRETFRLLIKKAVSV